MHGGKVLSTALRADDSLITADNREIRAIDKAGRSLFRVAMRGDAITCPALLANGNITLADSEGSVRMLRFDGVSTWEARLGVQLTGLAASSFGDGVYVTTQNGSLHAFDAAAGKAVWTSKLDNQPLGAPALAPFGFVYAGSSKGFHRLSAKDGSVVWSMTSESAISEAPAISDDDGAIFGSQGGMLRATTADGVVRWSHPIGAPLAASPIIDIAGHVFFTTTDRRIVALRDAGSDAVPLWTMHIDDEPLGSPVIGPLGALYVFTKSGQILELGGLPDVKALAAPLLCPCAALRCGVLLGICAGETGCRAILDCASDKKCRGNACRRPDVCDETIEQYGGLLGQSHALAAGLEDCVTRECPNCP